ncbi:MAG: hypothetical protein WD576_04850 [Nitriliruptoraceae bacterium]
MTAPRSDVAIRLRSAAARWSPKFYPFLRRGYRWLVARPAGDDARNAAALALRLTLITLLIGAPPATSLFTPIAAVAGLAVAGLITNRWYWLIVAGLFAFSPYVRPWLELDNHHWLQLYWFAAIAVTRFVPRRDDALQLAARLLVGFAFLFAVVWKVIAPEFLNGGFFDLTFTADRRLGDVAAAIGWQDADTATSTASAIGQWRTPGTQPEPIAVTVSESVARITPRLAWMTVVIEAAVAVAFLAPLRRQWRYLRDGSMVVFVVATYPLAPVVGFGRLLVTMAAMQSNLLPRVRTALYVTVFAALSLLSERDVALDWLRALFVVAVE